MFHEIKFVEQLASVRQTSVANANVEKGKGEESVGTTASSSNGIKLNSTNVAAGHRGNGRGHNDVVVKHRCSDSLKSFLGEDGIAMETVTRHIFRYIDCITSYGVVMK